MPRLKILSLNLHKGFSVLGRRLVIHELRTAIRQTGADIVFLQEVVGENALHGERHEQWPNKPQYEFLADELWSEFAYAKNAVYPAGHHGNAILSKYPIVKTHHINVSASPLEQRGILHAEISLEGQSLHCLCVHFGLRHRWRALQAERMLAHLHTQVGIEAPLIIAGDFNDWNREISSMLTPIGVKEVFHGAGGRYAKTFPAFFPLFSLDRVYYRAGSVISTAVHADGVWRRLSDHVPISTEIEFS